MVGALMSGLIYEAFGGKVMFLLNSAIAAFGSLIYYLVATLLQKYCTSGNYKKFILYPVFCITNKIQLF